MTTTKAPEKELRTYSSFRRFTTPILPNLIMLVASISFVYPVVWIFYSSVKTQREFDGNPISLPTSLHFDNYAQVLGDGNLLNYMFNTLRNTAISVFFILLFSFVIGYFLARFRFRGRGAMYGLFMLGMLVPVHALLVPLYILFSKVGLTDKWYSVPFPNIAFGMPIAIFLVSAYITTIPREIEEAAAIDGAGFTRTLFRIVMPLATPILVTVGIISFFNCWNEFSFSLVLLQHKELFSLPLGMTMFKGVYQSDYPKMMTTMAISIFPALLIYVAFSKRIIQGMMAGAIKG